MKIFFTSGYSYWGKFLPTDLRDPFCTTQVGGGETAMINVARELAARGHDVTVFYDVARPGTYDKVTYLPTKLFTELACSMDHDVLVSWDSNLALRYADRALLHILAFQLNDAAIGALHYAVDRYFHPSAWHAERFRELYPEISQKKQRFQITNGLDPYRYVQQVDRIPHRVIYSSSPDRGLHHLLAAWPSILAAVPDATLEVFYNIDKWMKTTLDLEAQGYMMFTADRAHAIQAAQVMGLPGVTYHGGVGQWRLAREQLASEVMVYPCDPVQPTEGFSMSCLEGISAGCKVITTNADALGELWSKAPNTTILPLPVDRGVLAEAVVVQLLAPPTAGPMVPDDYTWSAIAARWDLEMAEALKEL